MSLKTTDWLSINAGGHELMPFTANTDIVQTLEIKQVNLTKLRDGLEIHGVLEHIDSSTDEYEVNSIYVTIEAYYDKENNGVVLNVYNYLEGTLIQHMKGILTKFEVEQDPTFGMPTVNFRIWFKTGVKEFELMMFEQDYEKLLNAMTKLEWSTK